MDEEGHNRRNNSTNKNTTGLPKHELTYQEVTIENIKLITMINEKTSDGKARKEQQKAEDAKTRQTLKDFEYFKKDMVD